MPRPSLNSPELRSCITDLYNEGWTRSDILEQVKEEFEISMSQATLSRRLRDWGIPLRRSLTEDSEELRACLTRHYFEDCLSDNDIYRALKDEGFTVSLSGVTRIRREMQIMRRMDPDQVEAARQQLRQFFEIERQTDNLAHGMGRGMLYVHIRQQMYSLPRKLIWETYAEFHLSQILKRRERAQRSRAGWTCPGPDYIWSLDGYMKLAEYGIQVYASVDAYSRFIPWFYIGPAARTSRAVFAQYITFVSQRGYIPMCIRLDRGVETVLMAAAHYRLSKLAFEKGIRERRLRHM